MKTINLTDIIIDRLSKSPSLINEVEACLDIPREQQHLINCLRQSIIDHRARAREDSKIKEEEDGFIN